MKFRINVCQICLKAHLLPLGAVDPRVGCQLGFAWRSVARSIASSPNFCQTNTMAPPAHRGCAWWEARWPEFPSGFNFIGAPRCLMRTKLIEWWIEFSYDCVVPGGIGPNEVSPWRRKRSQWSKDQGEGACFCLTRSWELYYKSTHDFCRCARQLFDSFASQAYSRPDWPSIFDDECLGSHPASLVGFLP